jgi:hypothetical protein
VVDYLKIITCRVEQGSGWLINGGISVGELRSAVSDFWLFELRAEVGKVVVICGDGMVWRKNRKLRSEDGNLRGKIM